ncbi:MAG: fibronectin type III domain-containing protein [Treponema sp.]|nr:fibronectin type III domain-containing protein [Treponema sp.]
MKKIAFSLIILFGLLNLSCYSWYEDKINMDTKTQKFSLWELMYKEPEITSLDAPKQLMVSKGMYSGSIKLHWDEVPYATSYRIERAVVEADINGNAARIPDEGDFEVLKKQVYSNNYIDLILADPKESNLEYQKKYYYRVSAENINRGLESSEFTQISNESSGWLLSPPAQIEAAKGENEEYIAVKWSPVQNASRYLIYRGEKENGFGMEQIDSVLGNITSYNNYLNQSEKGIEFYYKICAVLESGSQSAFTGLAMGYSAKSGAPAAPTNIQVTNGMAESLDTLKVTWTAVNSSAEYTITYNLYRTSSEESIYTLVRANIPGATTAFEDASIPKQKTHVKYYYYLQTVKKTSDGETFKSPFSKTGQDSTTPAVGWLLSAPKNCEVIDSDNNTEVIVKWTPAVGYEDVNYFYNIYSSDTLDGDFSTNIKSMLGGSELTLGEDGYYSTKVLREPFYKITTVRITSNGTLESDLSQTIAPAPQAPQNVVASKTSALDGLEKYTPNTNGVYPVMITWEAPEGETPYAYYVYRSTKPDSSFRKISDKPVQGLSFIDENETARPGTPYYYKVVSLNMLIQGKNSNQQTNDTLGYGALTRDQWFREYNKTVKKSQTKLTLMHKASTDALGSESKSGDLSGSVSYNAAMQGLGARITMHYENYADFYVLNNPAMGFYFILTGDTNTTANMSANGSMDGTNRALLSSMYPGYAKYNGLEIKGGGAGGGYYVVCTQDKNGNTVLSEGNVSWTVGEE